MSRKDDPSSRIVRDHRRQWRDCLYVYPVISRRSKGLSIGVNLNPRKDCTYACLYCQIDRSAVRELQGVDIDVLEKELRLAMDEARSGRLWEEARFAETPPAMRRINDIAFSGDGEPTCLPNFDEAVAAAAKVRLESKSPDVKLVVITNATQFLCPQFQRALPMLDANGGEIWAKLDAGTEDYFQRVNRPHPKIPLRQILENIRDVARGREIVIQTLFFRIDGEAPPPQEIDAYCRRLKDILDAGGRFKLVQVHTIARIPAYRGSAAMTKSELDAIAEKIRHCVGSVPVEVFPGAE
jgi:wyosine [tRNA(Phe)-imidazoG37] synthetase (radical SAM superfamily)